MSQNKENGTSSQVKDEQYFEENAPPKGTKHWGSKRKLERGIFNNYWGLDYDKKEMTADEAAVHQFAIEYLKISEPGKKDPRVPQSKVFKTFEKWLLANDFELNELDPSNPKSHRQKVFSDILTEFTGVETGRPKIDGSRPKAYYGMDLSKLGKHLIVIADHFIEFRK